MKPGSLKTPKTRMSNMFGTLPRDARTLWTELEATGDTLTPIDLTPAQVQEICQAVGLPLMVNDSFVDTGTRYRLDRKFPDNARQPANHD